MKKSTLSIIEELIQRYPVLQVCKESIIQSVVLSLESYSKAGKLLVCGNGGSASDALHIVGELMKGFCLKRRISNEEQEKIRKVSPHADYIIENLQGAYPAIALVAETALLTAFANDMSAEMNFAQQVYGYGKEGDVLFAISTSGNSANVLYACEVAKAKKIGVIALTGNGGGMLKELADFVIDVPETETYKIQELHLPVYHAYCLAIENEVFNKQEG